MNNINHKMKRCSLIALIMIMQLIVLVSNIYAAEKEMQDINVHMATPVKINPNPVWEVGRSAWWGGVTGFLLGAAVDILRDDDNAENISDETFAIGILAGFGIGVYRISTKSESSAKKYNINIVPVVKRTKINNEIVLVYKWDILQYKF